MAIKTSVAPFTPEERTAMSDALAPVLAGLVDFGAAARVAHWNVRGPRFASLHKLFGKAYDVAGEQADALAEHIAMLGGVADGTVEAAAERSPLAPFPREEAGEDALLKALAERCTALLASAQTAAGVPDGLGDLATVDVLVDVQRALAKLGWMISAHLGGA